MSLDSALRPAFVRELARYFPRHRYSFAIERRQHAARAASSRDLFAWRRERAGIPDAPLGRRLELAAELDAPRPRPMRPALDGEAP